MDRNTTIWLRWDEEGNKIGAASFNNGMKDGAWKTWDAKGTLRYDMLYKNGEKVGLWTIYSENGEVLEQKSFGIN
ncbi:MAG: hypothetical protein HC842_05390 [Cytophagales bacterium]|nr:hypothetical protein [Cytophagales bacterium]